MKIKEQIFQIIKNFRFNKKELKLELISNEIEFTSNGIKYVQFLFLKAMSDANNLTYENFDVLMNSGKLSEEMIYEYHLNLKKYLKVKFNCYHTQNDNDPITLYFDTNEDLVLFKLMYF